MTDHSATDQSARLTAWVHGRVQGVGFRYWVREQAIDLRLVGAATNLEDGTVHIVAEGAAPSCRRLLERLRGGSTPGRVSRVVERWSTPAGERAGFDIQ